MPVFTLLTDFGLDDYYVAAVKGVVLDRLDAAQRAAIQLVDIGHRVPPGDIETAAFLLSAAAPCFPAGTVHLAVVDPGVGSDRRMLAVARGGMRYVAPDNGLLTPLLDNADAVQAVDRPDLSRAAPGATFHGRDRFAPIAAALLGGTAIGALGPAIDDPVRSSNMPPQRGNNVLRGHIRHIDHYGNVVTDLPAAWFDPHPTALDVRIDGRPRLPLRFVDHYALLPRGGDIPGALIGSLGTLECSLNGESLARRWSVRRGATITVFLQAPSRPSRLSSSEETP
ncbi:MAG: SAM-dependent chlorinase/fluorinase [Acidobacteriota bacterium]